MKHFTSLLLIFLFTIFVSSALELKQVPGLNSGRIQCMLIAKNGDIYAGTYGGGIYKSVDKGVKWEFSSNGIGFRQVYSIAQDSSDNIYVGSNDTIYVSTDDGLSWDYYYSITFTQIYDIQCSKTNLFFGTQYGLGIINLDSKKYDFASGIGNIKINRIFIDNLGRIFANGTKTTGGGFYISADEGDSWLFADDGLKKDIGGMNIYYEVRGIYQKDDDNLYAATRRGIYSSDDQGFSWVIMDNSLKYDDIQFITKTGDKYLVGTSNGVYLSSDMNTFDATGITIGGIKGCVSSNDDLFVFSNNSAIMYSGDKGANWENRINGLNAGIITDYNFGSNSNIVAVADARELHYFANNSWSLLNSDESPTLAIDGAVFVDDEHILAATSEGCWNVDLAGNWTQSSQGLPEDESFIKYILKSDEGNIIVCNAPGKLFISKDKGATWNACSGDTLTTYVTANFIDTDGTIYIGSEDGTLLTSSDGGSSWEYYKNPGNTPWFTSNIQAILKQGDKLFVSSTSDYNYRGLFVLENNGSTWQKYLDGTYLYSFVLYKNQIYTAIFDHLASVDESYSLINVGGIISYPSMLKTDGTYLYAASQGSGLMYSGSGLDVKPEPGNIHNLQISYYNNTLVINGLNSVSGYYQYRVYDLLGNIAASGNFENNSENPVALNISLALSQFYMINIISGNEAYNGKFIVE